MPTPRSLSLALALVSTVGAGCALKGQGSLNPIDSQFYASGSVYLYQPLNPTTIWVRDPDNLKKGETLADITSPAFKDALLRDLDTETVRVSLSQINGDANATLGIVGASTKGETYVLTVDYIKYFTSNKRLRFDYDVVEAGKKDPRKFDSKVPIYAGVGVRIRAEFRALEGHVNVAGLPALAIAANANQISGRLTVQTLGITGPQITGLMPIISDISVASIQSAVQAVAAIRAKLYEDSTVVYPKIVGFEAPADRIAAIPKITEQMYGLDLEVYPRVSPNPMTADGKPAILWISWFDDSKPELVANRGPRTGTNTNTTAQK